MSQTDAQFILINIIKKILSQTHQVYGIIKISGILQLHARDGM